MLRLSRESYKKSIMLKEKVVHLFSGPRESNWLCTEESDGMGNEEESNTGSFGLISNESV